MKKKKKKNREAKRTHIRPQCMKKSFFGKRFMSEFEAEVFPSDGHSKFCILLHQGTIM